jgi:hypothetical protein
MDRKQLIIDLVEATYDYVVESKAAHWDGKRPDCHWERAKDITARSCGAFRSWAIFAARGRVAVAADGYRVRDNKKYGGGLFVLCGPEDAQFVFPPDDSRSNHSLELRCSANAVLVNVTNEPGPWDAELPAMIEEIRAATKRCQDAVKAYDQAKRDESIQKRQSDLEAAKAAFSKG